MSRIISSDTGHDLSTKTELVLVCCHAVYTGDGIDTAASHWILQDFQRADPSTDKRSEHETFISHILLAAFTAKQSPQTSLVILSGGRTTKLSSRSEAEGYSLILSQLLSSNPSLFPVSISFALEEHATDSYQNLLFSILRFRQLTGSYPRRISVITHAFKEKRFLSLHGPALRWPTTRLRVSGLNPGFTAAELEVTAAGERDRAARAFEVDPYGVRAPLAGKRIARNWVPGKVESELARGLEPVVERLLNWNGGEDGKETFPDVLPWDET